MAVGRLPRNQRNIGGAGRPPRDQRSIGDSNRRSTDGGDQRETTTTTTAVAPPDFPSAWSAALLAPTRAVRRGSRESFVIQVEAPINLLEQRAQIGLEARDGTTVWGSATWTGAPGPRRKITATFGARPLSVPPGWYRVLVRVNTLDQAPVLAAGAVAVS